MSSIWKGMKQCLLLFMRTHLSKRGVDLPIFGALREPRLAKAVAAIVDAPAAAHTVESLALLCGMSRTGFSESFSPTFGEGRSPSSSVPGCASRLDY